MVTATLGTNLDIDLTNYLGSRGPGHFWRSSFSGGWGFGVAHHQQGISGPTVENRPLPKACHALSGMPEAPSPRRIWRAWVRLEGSAPIPSPTSTHLTHHFEDVGGNTQPWNASFRSSGGGVEKAPAITQPQHSHHTAVIQISHSSHRPEIRTLMNTTTSPYKMKRNEEVVASICHSIGIEVLRAGDQCRVRRLVLRGVGQQGGPADVPPVVRHLVRVTCQGGEATLGKPDTRRCPTPHYLLFNVSTPQLSLQSALCQGRSPADLAEGKNVCYHLNGSGQQPGLESELWLQKKMQSAETMPSLYQSQPSRWRN